MYMLVTYKMCQKYTILLQHRKLIMQSHTSIDKKAKKNYQHGIHTHHYWA